MRVTSKYKTVRWADICRSLAMLGFMDSDFTKAECLRVAKWLDGEVKAGRVERVARGRYRLTNKA